jgi:type IV pilus assembly protein PilA
VLALALSASLALVPSDYRPVILIPLAIVAVPIFIAAVFRAMGRIRRLARAGHGGAAFKATLLLGVAFLPVVLIVAIVGLAIPNLKNLKRQANEMSAIMSIRTINTAEIIFESTYPANGYACSLTALGGDPNSGPPSPTGAQLLQAELAGGNKSGYSFAIGNCSKVNVNGTDRITAYSVTATPLNVGQTGNRGFCSDQSGTIKYDPSGGTNCTQPLAGDPGGR